MKREPYKSPLKLHRYKKIKTWFIWNECNNCGHEFRREDGWEIWRLNDKIHPQRWFDPYYLCNECVDGEEELVEHLLAIEKRYELPHKKD